MPRLLIADDDQAICKTLQMHYTRQGFDVITAHTADEGYRKFLAEKIDAVVSDVRMPGEDGFSLLARIRHKSNVPVVMITAFHDLDTTVTAVKGGATDFVPKPLDIRELDDVIFRALEKTQAHSTGLVFPNTSTSASGMIAGTSKAMQDAFRQIALVSQNVMPVLVNGEPGTGKELVASAIHKSSSTCDHPFVVVNCAAMKEDLLEREIFGYMDEEGQFIRGKLDLVGSGTIFLDEISELSPMLQSKFIHVLEKHKYMPQGSTSLKQARARIVAASNQDIQKLVYAGKFREDFLYRLNVVAINLPPLRERKEDILPLVEHLLRRINTELRKRFRNVTGDVISCLKAYDWPGNVRELEHVLMKAAVMETGSILSTAYLPDEIAKAYKDRKESLTGQPAAICAALPVDDSVLPSLRDLESQYIEKILERTNWHKGKACEILEISRPKLDRHINDFGLKKPQD
ncbi:sigma-54 dependent transcriptional regulator [Terasakiella sp. A23]|uniref:sigma-54-dependent transcriptional regulator n=1 Tax=Terasakiella sp. FCG-A23 TaxID=3080561 RepID=UPI002954F6FA|nr:sigma-54 dependent transcriptional regulator [Terasakiella sp. A23]MDV7339144.1 sigma-54 dependent transcriptional regulator [Terasakiella sp. A23]